MADLVQIDTDEEMDKYAEAELIASNPPPVSLLKNKKLSYNSTTRRNDVLASLSTGGYVKIGEEDISREDQVRQYSRELQGMDMPFDMADYEAAGFTAQEVEAAGVMPVTQEKSGRTEPLREGEQLRMLREGGDAAIAAPSRMFMRDDWNRGTVDVLSAIGVPAQQANQIADMVMGQVDTSGGTGIFDTGVGIIDFTPVGLAFGIEEIGDQLNRSIQADDKIGIGTGMLFMALSAAEAYPLTKAGAKAVKAQIPAIRKAIADLGQSAEERIAQEGTTLFSNPVGPAVDRGLAAAGRLAEGDRPSADELRKQANIERFGYDPNDPVANVQAPTETTPGIIAFHGSGADFDEFKLEKIGTGEGNQAFGYGLYSTEKEDIAKFYRDSVGAGNEVTYKGKVIQDLDQDFADENNIAHMAGQQETPEDMQRVVADEVRRTRNNLAGIEQSIKDFQENPDVYPLKFHGMEISMETAEKQRDFLQRRLDAALEVQDNIGKIKTKPAGTMYEVSLHVNSDELIDYDKTFDEQSAFVQGAILKVLDEVNLDDAMNMGVDVFSPPYNGNEEMALQATKKLMLDNFSTVSFLNDWSVLRGAENSGEELLGKHGVKGIKYKAQGGVGARNVPETGANNYVIFDDKLVNIMKKYGIVGPVAVTAMKSEEQEET